MAPQSAIAQLRPIESSRGRPRLPRPAVLSVLLVLAFGGLALVYDFGAHPALYLFGISVCFGMLWAWVSSARDAAVSLPTLLAVGILLRAFFLPLPPSLSDDIYRYLWDGKVVLAGENPYALAPEADSLEQLRGPIWDKTAHRGVETVYPPLALGLFSIAALLPSPLLVYKILLVVLDLLGCLFLWRLAADHGIPSARVAWYAWNPLVVVEGAGMGHIDLAGASAVIAAIWLLGKTRRSFVALERQGACAFESASAPGANLGDSIDHRDISARRVALAALFTAAGVLIKLVPVVVLPLWIRLTRLRALFAVVSLGLLTAAAVAVLGWTGGVPSGLLTYARSWEFNGLLFEPLWRLLDWLAVDDALHFLLDGLKQATGFHRLLEPLYALAYPQLIAKALLAAGILAAVLASLRERELLAGSGRLLTRVLLLSATLYPWYLIWALPLAALLGMRSFLVLAWSIQFAYLPALCGIDDFPGVFLLVWTPFAWVAATGFVRRRSAISDKASAQG